MRLASINEAYRLQRDLEEIGREIEQVDRHVHNCKAGNFQIDLKVGLPATGLKVAISGQQFLDMLRKEQKVKRDRLVALGVDLEETE